MERPPLRELLPGVYQLAMPIPVPLKVVNIYLLPGPQGWTVVDTGFHTPETEDRWRLALEALGIGFRDIETIVVTHYHPDHMGCAGWLQEQSGAPVLMLRQEIPQAEGFWRPGNKAGEAITAFFKDHGMPAGVADALTPHHREQVERVAPFPRITPVEPGDELRLGRWRFQVLW
ncbi:MAG TPA: MBL fold metallo-hydrolase, partial [Limnochorda sp.]